MTWHVIVIDKASGASTISAPLGSTVILQYRISISQVELLQQRILRVSRSQALQKFKIFIHMISAIHLSPSGLPSYWDVRMYSMKMELYIHANLSEVDPCFKSILLLSLNMFVSEQNILPVHPLISTSWHSAEPRQVPRRLRFNPQTGLFAFILLQFLKPVLLIKWY